MYNIKKTLFERVSESTFRFNQVYDLYVYLW